MRSRGTGARRLSRTPRTIVAALAVAVTAAAVTAAALAGDEISADGDAVAAGSNNPVALGTVAPGATVSRTVRFTLECKTQQHVDAGDTVSLSYSASGSSIPAGGGVSAGAGSIIRPSGWPADGAACASPAQTVSSGGVGTGSDGSVSLTAPSAPGSYTYVVQYDIGGTGQPNDISGSNVKLTYTLTVADSTPPSITPSVSGTLGGNGWFVSDVAVAWTVTDAQSPLGSQTGCGPTTVVADTPGATFTCSAASAGGSAAQSVTIKRDATIPTVAIDDGVPTSTTTGSLLVTGTAADATSGIASVAVNGEDASFGAPTGTFSRIVTLACGPNTIAATSTDSAGNASAAVTRTVDYICDSTAPSITPSVSGTLGSNGWYTDDVGIAWGVADGESAVSFQTGCNASSVVADSAGVTFTCSATSAGGTATESVTIKRDATAPLASASAVSGASPYLAGTWTREDVVVSYGCSDAMSGVAATAADDDDVVSAESASGSASGSCVDEAGNSASVSFSPIKIDRTAPSASASAVSGGGEYLAGTWTRNDVVVSYACSDDLSGVASTPTDDTLIAESASASASGTCVDEAGNSSSAFFGPIKMDKTAPSVEFTGATPAANAPGWHDSDVTVTFEATDALSGFAPSGLSRSAEVVSSGEGDPVLVQSPAFTDLAGNTAAAGAATRAFRIDKTDPSIVVSAVSGGSPYSAGTWTNQDVTVSYECSDALSGVAATPDDDDDTVSAESASGSASGTCYDEAGNSSPASFSPIRIDKTAPTISASAVSGGDPYAAGTWTNQDVVVSYACSDALSGVAGGADDDDAVSTESASGSASGSCLDEAGNSASASFSPIKIDRTAPSLTFAGQSPAKNTHGWNRVTVTLTWSCTDELSGPVSPISTQAIATEGENQRATGTCFDLAGNSATATDGDVDIDKTKPTLGITGSPAGTAFVVCTPPTRPAFAPADALSGLDGSQGDTWTPAASASGVGTSTYEAHATDRAGNAMVETRSYTTTYGSSAVAQSPFLQPINKEGTSRFKLGSTIPVKFQALCNGIPVSTVVAGLYVKQGDAQPDPGVDEAFSTSAATSGNLFRWSDGQYIFNLSTKLGHGNPDGSSVAAFGAGTWTVKVGLDDGTWRSVNVQLVK